MHRLWYTALLFGIAATSRAELRLVGVVATGRATYFAVASKGPARFVQLGERVEGWELVAYDQRGALRLRKDDQLKVLLLPQGWVRDSDPLARACTLAAAGDKEMASIISWIGDIAVMKMEALRKLNSPDRADVSRLEAHVKKLDEWEAIAKKRATVLVLASETEP